MIVAQHECSAVWASLTRAFARHGVTGTMLLFWLMTNPDVRAAAPPLFEYAVALARVKRVVGLVVGFGAPFERHYTTAKDHPITHVMMFGGNAMDENVRITQQMKSGKIAVPLDVASRESFHLEFYNRMRNTPREFDEKYSVVEMKAPLETQRLVIDIDFKVGKTGTITACEESVAPLLEAIRACLAIQFPEHRPRVWHKPGTWRLSTHYGTARPELKWGVHIYTNVIASARTISFLGQLLRQSVALPPGGTMDDASFTGTGLRIDGCHKIMRCPNMERTCDAHFCRYCQGRRVVLIAPPYHLDDTYEAWRQTLLCPLPFEEEWKLAPEVMRELSKKRVSEDAVLEAGRKRQARVTSAVVDPRVDSAFSTPVNLPLQERLDLCEAMRAEYPQFGKPTRVHKDSRGNYFFSTAHRQCPFKKGEHRSSTMYIFCDSRTRRASLRCRHPPRDDADPCKDARSPLSLSAGLKERLFGAGVGLDTWDLC